MVPSLRQHRRIIALYLAVFLVASGLTAGAAYYVSITSPQVYADFTNARLYLPNSLTMNDAWISASAMLVTVHATPTYKTTIVNAQPFLLGSTLFTTSAGISLDSFCTNWASYFCITQGSTTLNFTPSNANITLLDYFQSSTTWASFYVLAQTPSNLTYTNVTSTTLPVSVEVGTQVIGAADYESNATNFGADSPPAVYSAANSTAITIKTLAPSSTPVVLTYGQSIYGPTFDLVAQWIIFAVALLLTLLAFYYRDVDDAASVVSAGLGIIRLILFPLLAVIFWAIFAGMALVSLNYGATFAWTLFYLGFIMALVMLVFTIVMPLIATAKVFHDSAGWHWRGKK